MNQSKTGVNPVLSALPTTSGAEMKHPVVRWGLLYAPWLWLLLFGLFSLAAGYQAGGLPVLYGHPDPKAVAGPFGLLYVPVIVLAFWVLASIPITLLLFGQKIWRLRTFAIEYLLWYLLGVAMWAFVVVGDLFGLITWLSD